MTSNMSIPATTYPWPSESAFSNDVQTAVGGTYVAVHNVDAILIFECGFRSLPSGDTATTTP